MSSILKLKIKLTRNLSVYELKNRLLAMGGSFDITINSKKYLKSEYMKQLKNPRKAAFIANKLRLEGYDKVDDIFLNNKKLLTLKKIKLKKNLVKLKKVKVKKIRMNKYNSYRKDKSIFIPNSEFKISTYYLDVSALASNKKIRLTLNQENKEDNDIKQNPKQLYSTNRSCINLMSNLKNRKFKKWNINLQEDKLYQIVKGNNLNNFFHNKLKHDKEFNHRLICYLIILIVLWIVFIYYLKKAGNFK